MRSSRPRVALVWVAGSVTGTVPLPRGGFRLPGKNAGEWAKSATKRCGGFLHQAELRSAFAACLAFAVIGILLLVTGSACTDGADTPAEPTPDIEATQAIMSFTQQALEIEAERSELMAYFASLRDRVGIHGQAFAIEKYLVQGVPPTLVSAPPSGLKGMTFLRNRLLLLVSPEPMQSIKDTLVHIYNSEIEQAMTQEALLGEYGSAPETQQTQIQSDKTADWGQPVRKLVYPEITRENLDYWRRSVESSESGPIRDLFRYKVGTVWFGIQEFRQQAYIRWTEVLKEHDLDLVLDAPEGDSPQTPECIGEEAYGPEVTYVKLLGFNGRTPGEINQLSRGRPLHYVFRAKQRFGIYSELGLDAEACWEEFAPQVTKDLYEGAGQILSGLYQIGPEQRAQLGLTFEPGVSGDSEELQDLMYTALRSHMGYSGARRIADRLPIERQLWRQKVATGVTELPFLEWLGEKYGLGRFSGS